MKKIYYLCVLVPIVIFALFEWMFEWPRWVTIFLIVDAIVILVFILLFAEVNADQKHKGELKWGDNTLAITKRNKYITSNITIKPYEDIQMKYNPAQLTYTGMSVGRVSVGSFNVTDESSTLTSRKTSKYYLNFGDGYNPIDKIILTDELVKSASNHPVISKYLKGNTLVLWDRRSKINKLKSSAISHYASRGNLEDTITATNILMSGASKSELSYRECASIKKWLKGK